MSKTKFEKLMAIKEEFARTQARLAEIRKLEESAHSAALSTLLENDLEQAELVLAAQDMTHKLQNMAEDLAKMNAQDLFPLVDKMKAAFGQEAAHSFEATAQEAISQAMNTVRHAKDQTGNAILRLEGKLPANDMAKADASEEPVAAEPDMATDDAGEAGDLNLDAAMDDFGGADAASGPDAEPLGRARKESVETNKAPLRESVILEAAGRKLLETESLESLIDWVLNEAAMGMPEDHFRSFAKSVAVKASQDPVKLAGWIGKKKHGMAAMAQLAEPTFTQSPDLDIVEGKFADKLGKAALGVAGAAALASGAGIAKNAYDYHTKVDPDTGMTSSQFDDTYGTYTGPTSAKGGYKVKEDELEEGKSFRHNGDEDEETTCKHEKFKARDKARRRKNDDNLDEGKTFKRDPEDEDDDVENWSKKHQFKARDKARKNKDSDKLDETTLAARAIASLIEASIAREGKGNAAKAVKEAVAYFVGKNLVESEDDAQATVLEAFKSEFGMTPASYSVLKLKELAAPMSAMDKKNANSALGKLAGKMGANKSAGNQSVQTAMSGMTGQERSAATKMLNTMKQNGQNPKNAAEFAQQASSLVDDDKVNENINAAQWPVDSAGQYKGEPFQTDYMKLKASKGTAKTEMTGKSPAAPAEEATETPEPQSQETTEADSATDEAK